MSDDTCVGCRRFVQPRLENWEEDEQQELFNNRQIASDYKWVREGEFIRPNPWDYFKNGYINCADDSDERQRRKDVVRYYGDASKVCQQCTYYAHPPVCPHFLYYIGMGYWWNGYWHLCIGWPKKPTQCDLYFHPHHERGLPHSMFELLPPRHRNGTYLPTSHTRTHTHTYLTHTHTHTPTRPFRFGHSPWWLQDRS